MIVRQLRALQDNYVYLLHSGNQTAVVDPSEAGPVLAALKQTGWRLDFVLNTHHHWDHVGGNETLKRETGCRVLGSQFDRDRIPGLDQALGEGESFRLGEAEAKILEIPGHTLGHIAYCFVDDKALFCGDTLFSIGCGRLFEGTPEQMWRSLGKLAVLPDDVRVFCGHEYTVANLSFALTLEPGHPELGSKLAKAKALRSADKPTVPSLLGEEKRLNPFLKAPSAQAFAEVRRRKDTFRG